MVINVSHKLLPLLALNGSLVLDAFNYCSHSWKEHVSISVDCWAGAFEKNDFPFIFIFKNFKLYFEFHQQSTDVSVSLNGIAAGKHYFLNVLGDNIFEKSVSKISFNERNNWNWFLHTWMIAQSPKNMQFLNRLTVSDDNFWYGHFSKGLINHS